MFRIRNPLRTLKSTGDNYHVFLFPINIPQINVLVPGYILGHAINYNGSTINITPVTINNFSSYYKLWYNPINKLDRKCLIYIMPYNSDYFHTRKQRLLAFNINQKHVNNNNSNSITGGGYNINKFVQINLLQANDVYEEFKTKSVHLLYEHTPNGIRLIRNKYYPTYTIPIDIKLNYYYFSSYDCKIGLFRSNIKCFYVYIKSEPNKSPVNYDEFKISMDGDNIPTNYSEHPVDAAAYDKLHSKTGNVHPGHVSAAAYNVLHRREAGHGYAAVQQAVGHPHEYEEVDNVRHPGHKYAEVQPVGYLGHKYAAVNDVINSADTNDSMLLKGLVAYNASARNENQYAEMTRLPPPGYETPNSLINAAKTANTATESINAEMGHPKYGGGKIQYYKFKLLNL